MSTTTTRPPLAIQRFRTADLPAWNEVAARMCTVMNLHVWPGNSPWDAIVWSPTGHSYNVRGALAEFTRYRRSPAEVHDLLDAVEAAVPLYPYPHSAPQATPWQYGWDVTGPQWSALWAAHTSDGMAEYRSIGLTPTQAADLACAGVNETIAQMAWLMGVPQHEWADRFAGWSRHWVTLTRPTTTDEYGRERPDPYAAPTCALTPMDAGWSEDDLRVLACHEWGLSLSCDVLSGQYKPDLVFSLISAGIPADRVADYAIALKQGGANRDGAYPALAPDATTAEAAQAAITFTLLNVRPPLLVSYRAAGCRSTDDVIALASQGVTGVQVRHYVRAEKKAGTFTSDLARTRAHFGLLA